MFKTFDRNDPYYYGEEAFGLIHYRNAAIIGAILGMISLSVIVFCSIMLQTVYEITGLWSTVFVLLIAVSVFITNILMIYGIVSENSKIMLPQMATLQIEIVVLIIIAILSIFSMSCGLSVTNYVFNFFINVEKTEKNFGPIWPFNISALAFVGSLACIWFHAIVKGAYEYLLDKNYFDSLNITNINIEMVNKTKRK